MKKLEIRIPDVAHIIITGPMQCGKSIVMDRIAKILQSEFGANVVSEDLERELNGNNYDNLDGWQVDMVRKTVWVLMED